MVERHLSVEDVARFVDVGLSLDRSVLGQHVDQCEDCRRAIAAAIRAGRNATQPQHARDDDHPGERVDRYAVFETVGIGGMGAVYRAYDPRLDRKVALKILRPALCDEKNRERMQREAKMLARITHPNVVAVYDAGTWHDRVYIAMEFVAGATLRDWLAERTRTTREILDVLLQAADGLACAHDAGLVHRDFKPHNVLIGNDGRARVSDFGLAELGTAAETHAAASASLDAVSLTATGAVIGTPLYMSPEQASGKAVDAKSDQFSFCVTAYEALFRERPFSASSFTELTARLVSGKLPEPPRHAGVPRWLVKAVMRGLEVEPAQRFASMAELAATLRRRRTHKTRIAVAALALGGLALAGWFALVRPGPSPSETCDAGAAAAASTMWNPQRAQVLHAALGTKRAAYAHDLEQRAVAALDTYASQWRSAHVEACRATHVYRHQSAQLLDIRMACLDDRRRHVNALIEHLMQIDRDALRAVPQAIAGLPSFEHCGDLQELAQQEPPPNAGARKQEYDALADELSAANVSRDFGEYDEGLARLDAALPRVQAFGAKSLLARFRYLQGELTATAGRHEPARKALEEALALAEASRDQLTKIVSLVRLYVIATEQGDKEAAERWSRLAEAAIDASTSVDPVARAAFGMAQGMDAYQHDDMTKAAAKFEQALALSRQDPESTLEIALLTNLGSVYYMQERDADAKQKWQEALAKATQLYGAMHPDVGRILNNVGMFEAQLGDPNTAIEHFSRALAIEEATLAPAHPSLGNTHIHIADIMQRVPEHASDVAKHFKTGIAILEAAYPKGSPDVTAAAINYGIYLSDHQDYRTALAIYQRVLALDEVRLGASDPTLATLVHGVGAAQIEVGELAPAVVQLRRALALYTNQPSPSEVQLANVERDLARAIVESHGKRSEALALLASALVRYRGAKGDYATQITETEAYAAELRR